MALGVGVLAGCSVLPEKWLEPIIGQIALPAHAATSGENLAPTSPTESVEPETTEGYNSTEVYSLRSIPGNDKRFAWLNETGAHYGGRIKFVYSHDCGELLVPDAKITHGADGNSDNYNQAFYFCGTDFAPEAKENNGGRASVFTPPGCPATTVTLYYNR